MAKKTDGEKQKEKELKQLEKIEKMLEKKAFKYKKVDELQYDLNERLKMALQNGGDPLGILSITQIYEDIQTVNKLKGLNIDEPFED